MLAAGQRVRVRFRKEGDLRMISHRDLARLFERLLRRAGLPLSMSRGFHPKARISFPSALSLGIRGIDEVVQIELAETVAADELLQKLVPHLPAGLSIETVHILDEGEKKARVEQLSYEINVPPSRQTKTQMAIDTLLAQPSFLIHREGRDEPVDVRASLDHLQLAEGVVHFRLLATTTASVRPREVLGAIGLSDLEDQGFYLTRTAVQLASPTQQKRTWSHEKGNAD